MRPTALQRRRLTCGKRCQAALLALDRTLSVRLWRVVLGNGSCVADAQLKSYGCTNGPHLPGPAVALLAAVCSQGETLASTTGERAVLVLTHF